MARIPLDPALFGGPGHVMTVDGCSSIALCGGWEMSTTCRRGPRTNLQHDASSDWSGVGEVDWHCKHCKMPLHVIGSGIDDSQLMSIEHHYIEEIPW